MNRCDFCSSRDVQWTYPARNFAIVVSGSGVWGSRGGWMACGQCAELIERDAVDELLTRAARSFAQAQDVPFSETIVEAMAPLVTGFRLSRRGPRVPAYAINYG